MKNYLSIDPGEHNGIAFCSVDMVFTYSIVGNPIDSFAKINKIVKLLDIQTIVIEKFNYFAMKTKAGTGSIPISSLLKRIGYYQYSFQQLGYETIELGITTARKQIGFVGKENNKQIVFKYFSKYDSRITKDCSDAITLLLCALQQQKESVTVQYYKGTI